MRLRDYIKAHRKEIDAYIRRKIPHARIDDEERRLWILNEEPLYNAARDAGCRI